MRELDKSKVYDLSELKNEEYNTFLKEVHCGDIKQRLNYYYHEYFSNILEEGVYLANAKELFYTLENVQVDCRELTEEQINEMCKVYESNGYEVDRARTNVSKHTFTFLRFDVSDVWCGNFDGNKTTITYEKFMELFNSKYEVKYIAEAPNEVFNPQPHYNNENGSLYKIANDLGLNHWEFDIFKRLVRCRKKNQFKEDLQKIKDTIDIYLNEYSE